MQWIDITVSLDENVPVYPGDACLSVSQSQKMADGDSYNLSTMNMGVHTATHVDAPAHFILGGRKIDELSLEKLIGDAIVVEINTDGTSIEAHHLTPEILDRIEKRPRVLFKTRNSCFWTEGPQKSVFQHNFVGLGHEAARLLVERNLQLVAIDYLSIEPPNSPPGFPTHMTLLGKEVVVLEGVDLRSVEPGPYHLVCLPLKLAVGTGDGAPARAVLRKE